MRTAWLFWVLLGTQTLFSVLRCAGPARAAGMPAADPVAGDTQDAYWADEFFGEEHIIGTFQHLLHDTQKTVEVMV